MRMLVVVGLSTAGALVLQWQKLYVTHTNTMAKASLEIEGPACDLQSQVCAYIASADASDAVRWM